MGCRFEGSTHSVNRCYRVVMYPTALAPHHSYGGSHNNTPIETSKTSLRQRPYMLRVASFPAASNVAVAAFCSVWCFCNPSEFGADLVLRTTPAHWMIRRNNYVIFEWFAIFISSSLCAYQPNASSSDQRASFGQQRSNGRDFAFCQNFASDQPTRTCGPERPRGWVRPPSLSPHISASWLPKSFFSQRRSLFSFSAE